MLLQINQLFLLNLQKVIYSTSIVIAIIQICLLPLIMTLGEFLQYADQFNFYCCLDVKEQIFLHWFILEG